MASKLVQLQQRIDQLEALAKEIPRLVDGLQRGDPNAQPDLSMKGERWYRGARELLKQSNFSGIEAFDSCYGHNEPWYNLKFVLHADPNEIRKYGNPPQCFDDFRTAFLKSRAMLIAVLEELQSRELPVITQLSFRVAANEFETARELLQASTVEPILRASGVVARVALERHLFTVAESRSVPILKNPPHKKKADVEDILTSLVKALVITPIQESELKSLFKIGNNCAHPKEQVQAKDVGRLIDRGTELASQIL